MEPEEIEAIEQFLFLLAAFSHGMNALGGM